MVLMIVSCITIILYRLYMKQECEGRQRPINLQIEQCENHRVATSPGNILSVQVRCKCCHRPIVKQALGFCFKEQQILHLGPGAPLFFRYLAILVLAAFVPMAAYSVITLIANFKSEFSIIQSPHAQSWAFKLSNINSLPYYDELYSYIFAGSIVFLTIFIPLAAKYALNVHNKIYQPDNQFYHIQPLSVLFKLEKPANYTQSQVEQAVNQWYEVQSKIVAKQFHPQTKIIQKIYFHFNAQLYEILKAQLEKLQEQKIREEKLEQQNNSFEIFDRDYKVKQSKVSRGSKASQSVSSNKHSSKIVFSKIGEIQNLKQRLRKRQLQKTNKFIVVFKKLEYAQLVKAKKRNLICRKSINDLIFPGQNRAEVEEAPYPREILYKNQHLVYKSKVKTRILSWLFNILIIAIGSGLQFGILSLYFKFGLPSIIAEYASIFIGVIFVIFAEIGCKLSTIFVQKQHHSNLSHKISSINKHRTVTNLSLQCISVIIVYNLSGIQLYSTGGLVQTATWIVIIAAIILLAGRLLNFRIINSCCVHSKVIKKIKKLEVDQRQANQMFEKSSGDQQELYSGLTSLVIICFAYGSIVPVAPIVCFLCLVMALITERICFAYIYKEPQPSSDHLFVVMASILWKSTLFMVVGHLYFMYQAQNLDSQFSLIIKIIFSILLGITIIITLLPPSIFKRSTIDAELQYSQIKQKIIDCYSQFNPLYCFKMADAPTKSVSRMIAKNQILQQELNTMSKTLQTTLREKLFNNRPSILEGLVHHDEPSELPFEYDEKVKMPEKKPIAKYKVPPIFKANRQDSKIKKKSQNAKKSKQIQNQLIKLTNLVPFQQQEEGQDLKHKIKQAIKESIQKIK